MTVTSDVFSQSAERRNALTRSPRSRPAVVSRENSQDLRMDKTIKNIKKFLHLGPGKTRTKSLGEQDSPDKPDLLVEEVVTTRLQLDKVDIPDR